MDKQLQSFSKKFNLNFFNNVEEIQNNFEGFLDEFPQTTSICGCADFHDFQIVGFVMDGKLYRLGNEDYDESEDPSDVIPMTFDELEFFYKKTFE